MEILKGLPVAQAINEELIKESQEAGIKPHLAITVWESVPTIVRMNAVRQKRWIRSDLTAHHMYFLRI